MHLVVSCYPVLVDRDVLGIQELTTRTVLSCSVVGEGGEKARRNKKGGREKSRKRDKDAWKQWKRCWWRMITKLMLRGAAGIHESLGHHAQTWVHYIGLPKVKHKVGVLDQVHPEPVQRDKWWELSKMIRVQYLRGSEFDFHVWTTSLSVIPCCKAWSSRKSNKYCKYNICNTLKLDNTP